jgi:PAS domain S-box-containing protein
MPFPIPLNEEKRQAALDALTILDTPNEPFFDSIVALATEVLGYPVSAISLVDRDRQWFKAIEGLNVRETSRDVAFCAHAICQTSVLFVPDAKLDQRFFDNPIVTGDPQIRSYAGAPLVTSSGHSIGTLCVIDQVPRQLTASESAKLKTLADLVIQHIESLAQARKALQSETLQNVILETMAEGVVVHAPDGRVRFANDAALSILGLTLDELIGATSMDPRWQSLREDGTPYPGEEHPAMVVLRTGKTVENATMQVARPDGTNKWIKINARPMANPSLPDQAEVVVTFSDISDERNVQTRLLAKKQRLELALSVGAIGVVERNLNTGEIAKFGSSEAHTAFGPLDNVGPGTFLSMVKPEYKPQVLKAWEEHLNGGPGVRIEAPLITADGAERWALFGAEKLLDAQNNHCGALVAFKDIHERKLSEFALIDALKKLEAAAHAKDDFLANVSHEIRTPLNGVVGMAAALAATSLTSEQRQMASLLVSSGEVLSRLMNDLLDMAKLDAGKMTLQCEPFDLCEAVVEATQLYEIRADEKAIGFQIEIAPEARGEWSSDRVRIKQIVSNLVSNAIKFTDKGRVRVRLSATGSPGSSDAEWVTVEVEDDGPGVSPDLEAKIFERFEQGARAKNGVAGTGLGLSICKSLIELMGGEILLTSQEGVGSTFTVRLPLTRVTKETHQAQESLSDRANLMRVLLVDDNPTNLAVAQAMLRAFGCEIVTAQDGQTGVEAFKSGKFDVVLMDMSMPGMDGAEATRAIRKFERDTHTRRTPLAMLTAYGSDQHKRESESAGADFHIVKPVTPVSLLAGLEKAMRATKDQVAA